MPVRLNSDKTDVILEGIASHDHLGGPTALASLVQKNIRTGSPKDFKALSDAYLTYYRQGSHDSGDIFKRTHRLIEKGIPRYIAVRLTHYQSGYKTQGCNPLHRGIVLGGNHRIGEEDLYRLTCKDSRMTHFDRIAGISTYIGALACRHLLLGHSLESIKHNLESNPHWHLVSRFDWAYGTAGHSLKTAFLAEPLIDQDEDRLNFVAPTAGAIANCYKHSLMS